VAKAITVLETKPNDPAANLLVGRYCCFVKGDWAGGLPLLAKGGDTVAQGVATAELKNPTDATGQLSLADGWWAYSETLSGSEKEAIQSHARDYYRKALPALTGLAKLKADARLAGSAKPQTSQDPPVAMNPTPTAPAHVTIVRADYGKDSTVSIAKGLQSALDADPFMPIVSCNAWAGDPSPHTSKSLKLSYRIGDKNVRRRDSGAPHFHRAPDSC